MSVFSNCFVMLRCLVINWARYYIYLPKAALFTLGLVFSHSLVDNAVVSMLMSYLTYNWKEDNLPKAAVIVNVQGGVSTIMALTVAHFSDAYIGRFKVILYSTAASIIGLVILSLSTNNGIFFLAAVLLAIGKGGRNPTLKAFLADQLTQHKQNMDIDEEQVEARTKLWWRVAGILGATISIIWISNVSWKRTFMISATVMGVAYLIFWFGINFYYNEEPTGSPFTLVYKVLKAAILHWLDFDKATISSYCTETDVMQVKRLLTLVPMWTTIFFYGMVGATESTFFIEQSSSMKAIIPINAFFLFTSLTSFTISYLIDLLIPKSWSERKQQHARLVRIGVGLICSILCCISAWQVEHHRLFLIKKFGIIDDHPNKRMSILWLAPQYFLLGLMDAFAEEGLSDFYYYLVPESMKLYESPFRGCVLGIGNFLSIPLIFVCRSWFGETINKSRLDNYFLMLATLGFGNLCFYGLVCYKYYACEESPEDVDLEDGRTNLVNESYSTSFVSKSFPRSRSRTTTKVIRSQTFS